MFSLDKTICSNYLSAMTEKNDPVQDFIEMMGLRFQDQQMPRIAGRLFGLLLLEGGPFSFGELADRLQVSRGSISSNARLLDDIGLIERVAKPGDRQDYYRIVPDGFVSLFRKQLAKLRWSDEYYRDMAERLPAHMGEAKRRLIATATYARKAADGLESGLAEADALLGKQEIA